MGKANDTEGRGPTVQRPRLNVCFAPQPERAIADAYRMLGEQRHPGSMEGGSR
jgi:hypothetical protein